jgi:hypothetical protein
MVRISDTARCSRRRAKLLKLSGHWAQVVTSREVIDIGAQSGPVAFGLRAIVPFCHHLIHTASAVHDLLHLYFRFQVVGCWIELASQTIRRTIEVIHGIAEIIFGLLGLVLPVLGVRRICTLAPRRSSAALRGFGPVLGVVSAIVEIFLEFVHAVLYLADALGNLPLRERICLRGNYGKADRHKNPHAAKYRSHHPVHIFLLSLRFGFEAQRNFLKFRAGATSEFVQRTGKSFQAAILGQEIEMKGCPVCEHYIFASLPIIGFEISTTGVAIVNPQLPFAFDC